MTVRNRHANGDGQPIQAHKGTVLLLHFSHPVAGTIHFVDYAVDQTARLARLRAGAGPPLIRAAVGTGGDLRVAPTDCLTCQSVVHGSTR
jgi:hypothetical protein